MPQNKLKKGKMSLTVKANDMMKTADEMMKNGKMKEGKAMMARAKMMMAKMK